MYSITAPLSHTCTTYRPVVMIKKTTDISSGKKNKRLMSHIRPLGETVQMNEWSVSSLSNHLCNVTSIVCAHLCQQPRLFQNVKHWRFLTSYSFSLHVSFSRPLPLFFRYPFRTFAPWQIVQHKPCWYLWHLIKHISYTNYSEQGEGAAQFLFNWYFKQFVDLLLHVLLL